ncbi:MAG: hypothetical protein RJB68_1953 [Pseudomonadota bacterium]|jgi:hypothetical protein
MKRPWLILIASVLVALLAACGDRGKGAPPAEKKVVIGNAAQIKAKRLSTHHRAKPLPFGVTHKRFKDGKLLADDAPHPYIPLSGIVHIDPRKSKSLQITYHEDKLGTLSQEMPASFHISDTSIVEEVKVRPGTNQPLVSLTGKKGNSYITALDARGDAISKFMVLSAEPQEDVLFVDDPSIHPILCSGITVPGYDGACDADNATDFDLGHIGYKFSIDEFLNGTSTEKKIMFDDQGLEKLKALAGAGSMGFKKRAIYFESIDTLVVMNEGFTKISRQPFLNEQDRGKSPVDSSIKWFNSLNIHHVATQEEFNTYMDFGGRLSASPLRDSGVTDVLSHEITPDNPAEPVLVGAVFSNGGRVSASSESVSRIVGASRYPIESYIYRMLQRGEKLESNPLGVECKVNITAGRLDKFAITSLKSLAKLTLSGDFAWNDGRPNLGVDLNPQVNSGGQVKFFLDGRAKLDCGIELYDMKASEWGVPLFATVQFSIPVSFATDVGINGSAEMVLALPAYKLGSPSDTDMPGKVGINYTPSGGFKPDFKMQSTVAKDHLGIAEGTKLHDSTTGQIGMGYEVGLSAELALRAEVNAWILRAFVDATIGNILVGFKADGAYDIDTKKKTSKMSPKGDAGFGAFLEFSPTISVKTKFFTWSFNVYEYEVPPWWWYKLPMREGEEESFEPAEARDYAIFTYCDANFPCATQSGRTYKIGYLSSSEKLEMDSIAEIPDFNYYGAYFYQYVVRDKITGAIKVNTLPMNQADDGSLKLFKYGVVDILAEGVVTKIFNGGDSTCMYWFKGDESFKKYIDCLHWDDR